MAFLTEHWKDILLALLAIDAALIPIFPEVPFLVTLKNLLSGIAPKQP